LAGVGDVEFDVGDVVGEVLQKKISNKEKRQERKFFILSLFDENNLKAFIAVPYINLIHKKYFFSIYFFISSIHPPTLF